MSDDTTPTKLADIGLHTLIQDLGAKSQAAAAIIPGTIAERTLERLMLVRMRPLSNTTAANLFGGTGPLATFFAKIEIAHAFHLISDQTYLGLKIIKDVRNRFAHMESVTEFHDEEIKTILRRFEDWDGVLDPMLLFEGKVHFCVTGMEATMDRLIFEDANGDEPAP